MIGGMWVVSLLGNETSTNIPNNLTRLLPDCWGAASWRKNLLCSPKKNWFRYRFYVVVIKKGMPGTNAGLFMINSFNSSNRSGWLNDMICWLHRATSSKHNWSTSRTSRHFPQWDPPSQIFRLCTFVVIYRCKSKTQQTLSNITDAFNTYGNMGQAPDSCCDHLQGAHTSNGFLYASAWWHVRLQAVPKIFLQKGNGQWSFCRSNLKSYDFKNNKKKEQPTKHKNGDATSMSPCPPLFHINLAKDGISSRTRPHWRKPRIAIKCCQNGRIHKRRTWKCSLLKVGDRHHVHECIDCFWKHDATHWSCIT